MVVGVGVNRKERRVPPVSAGFLQSAGKTSLAIEKRSVSKVLKEARRSGSLSLIGRGLDQIPGEVFRPSLDEGEKFWEMRDLEKLDLTDNVLKTIEGAWEEMIGLRVLRCTRNLIQAVPKELPSSLVHLDLGHNALQGEFLVSEKFPEVRELCLQGNAISEICDEYNRLSKLEKLDISANKAYLRLPATLSNVLSLDLSTTPLADIEILASGKTLRSLSAQRCSLRSIDALVSFSQLIYLDLRDNALGPKLVLSRNNLWPSLGQLLLGGNALSELELSFAETNSLAVLDLSRNELRCVPAFIRLATSMHTLDLSSNHLSNLDPFLGFLDKLQRISLEGNPLRCVRRELIVAGTDKLKRYLRSRAPVDFSKSNQDIDFAKSTAKKLRDPESKGVLDLRCFQPSLWTTDAAKSIARDLQIDQDLNGDQLSTSLSTIDLSGVTTSLFPFEFLAALVHEINNPLTITQVKASATGLNTSFDSLLMQLVTTLPGLRRLDVSENRGLTTVSIADQSKRLNNTLLEEIHLSRCISIHTIPPALLSCRNLQSCHLTACRLTDLGLGWAALVKLEHLYAADNKLSSIGDIFLAPYLRTLDLSNNELRFIPNELGLAKNLSRLVLHGNPQRAIRAARLPHETGAVLAGLRKRLTQGRDTSATAHQAHSFDQDQSPALILSHSILAPSQFELKSPPSPPPPESPPPPDLPPPSPAFQVRRGPETDDCPRGVPSTATSLPLRGRRRAFS